MLLYGLVSLSLFYATTGVGAFSVTTSNADVRIKENEGGDLTCTYSGDFGANPRIEWKFNDVKGTQTYLVYNGEPTTPYSGRVTLFGSTVRFNKVTRRDNGDYDCVVSANGHGGETRVKLTVLVPPSPPMCRIPTAVTTGRTVLLSCRDNDGSPAPTYKWFKDGTLLPDDPKKFPQFKNFTYKMDSTNGNLEFPRVSKMDSAEYYCMASNVAGPPQRCKAVRMQVRDVNTGGIVAGVIVALLALALLGFGLWYAHKKGYLPKGGDSKPRPTALYQPPSLYGGGEDEEDGEFRQKSSFVV